ncbi:MAG: hypothetical protein M3119_11370 [Verrucomicrobiota bacterium]|nr:hypothetical protein [Verrucomicrobiota bacterium]
MKANLYVLPTMMLSKTLAICSLVTALFWSANAADQEKIPSGKELKALTRDSLLAFNKAVAAKDFTGFIAQVSKLWQEQVSATQLADIFKTFIDQEIDIAFVAASEPVFEAPPAIDGDGVLVLKGHYDTKPNKVEFGLKYIYEKPAWKLFGIDVHVTPAGAADVQLPAEAELRALAQDSLGNFNQAVVQKDFTKFHGQISTLWQKQITPAKLQESFRSFIEQEVDFSDALKNKPVFDLPPAIDENGILQMKGSLPAKPDRVQFEVGYIFEPPVWKLAKINVKISDTAEDEKK